MQQYDDIVNSVKETYFDFELIKKQVQDSKPYKFVLSTLGVEVDNTWGYVKGITPDGLLYKELIEDERLERLKAEIIKTIKEDFFKEFDSRRVKIKKDFIKTAKKKAEEFVVRDIETKLQQDLVEDIIKQIDTSALVKELKFEVALHGKN